MYFLMEELYYFLNVSAIRNPMKENRARTNFPLSISILILLSVLPLIFFVGSTDSFVGSTDSFVGSSGFFAHFEGSLAGFAGIFSGSASAFADFTAFTVGSSCAENPQFNSNNLS